MTYIYDGTYEGLLSAIFESYNLEITATSIVAEEAYQANLFDRAIRVNTDEANANRLLTGLGKKCGARAIKLVYHCFLSELPAIEMLIYHFIVRAFEAKENVLEDFRDEKILKLHQINKSIGREVHRMHAFVRFQETKDGIYAGLIEPDFNVLPLIGKHFVDRYPAQDWLIYDPKRRFGLFYDKEVMRTRFITFDNTNHKHLTEDVLTNAETDYQQLWQNYFNAVDIPERRNMKLHIRHVPRRYWKYLVEKWDQVQPNKK